MLMEGVLSWCTRANHYDKNFFVHDKISVRVSQQNMEETIGLIQTKYAALFPDMVFTWYFLDQKINEVYGNEKIARNQIVLFTALALIVACLGLLAMISNNVVEKTKEIGIRKVLGAQLHQIAKVLLNATVKQTIMATIVGIPIAILSHTIISGEVFRTNQLAMVALCFTDFDFGGDHVVNHCFSVMESSEY